VSHDYIALGLILITGLLGGAFFSFVWEDTPLNKEQKFYVGVLFTLVAVFVTMVGMGISIT